MTQPAVTLYTKEKCVQCKSTKLKLDKEGIVYDTVDVSPAYLHSLYSTDEVLAAEQTVDAIREMGHQQMPVMVVSAGVGQADIHWSGFRPDLITAHCKPASQ